MERSRRSGPDEAPCGEYDEELSALILGDPEAYSKSSRSSLATQTRDLCATLLRSPGEEFCLYGHASTAGCVLRQCSALRREASREARELREAGVPVDEAEAEYEEEGMARTAVFCDGMAEHLHGFIAGYSHYLEFLPDSGWPWTPRSLWHALGEWKRVSWQSDAALAEAVGAELLRQAGRWQRLALHSGGPGLPRAGSLRVFALGMKRT